MTAPLLLSIFPGIDLLGHAFEVEGWCVVRGPDPIWGGDIRSFHPPAGCWDGLIGGPPCQSFSALANLVRAKGYEPKFGNLIPEFARVVQEAGPGWWLMENVPAAPAPETPGYDVVEFGLEHSALDSGDGYGHEQMRRRLFRFGVRHPGAAVDLRRWIQTATWLLPMRAPTVTETHVTSTTPGPDARRRARPEGGSERRPAGHGASPGAGRDRMETGGWSMKLAAIDVPEVGNLRLVADASDIPPGWPRGRVWTNEELTHLRTVSPDQQEARAVAACKEMFGGVVVGAHLGDRGPAVSLELASMPRNTPTAKTRRYLDRGHGPKPGPQNFTLGGTSR